MIRKLLFVFSCVLFITIHTNGQYNIYGNYGQTVFGNEKALIQFYYESLCPACRHFYTQTFRKTVLDLFPFLDIQLYPYGFAKTIVNFYGDIDFQSQHGPAETYGNKLHACAVDVLPNMTMAVLFNSCMMENIQTGKGSDDAAADLCGSSMMVNSEAIKQCAKSNKGSLLLQYYGEESKKAGFKSVPTVLVNGFPASTENFKRDVCNALKNPPPACFYS